MRNLARLALIALLTVSACAKTTSPKAEEPRLPESVHYTFRWIPNGGADLMSADGTFLRALVESHNLATAGADIHWGYPGFTQALATKGAAASFRQGPVAKWGTEYFKIASITQQPNDTVAALVCEYDTLNSGLVNTDPNVYASGGSGPGYPITITYSRTGAAPPANQQGPRQSPTTDVFGGWRATEYTWNPPPPIGGGACSGIAPDGIPRSDTRPTVYPKEVESDKPLPSQPPYPGWPA